jgi:hypothetical protein
MATYRHDVGERADVGGHGRLHGHGLTDGAARAALRREADRCAAAARSEAQFFAALDAAGLLVRLRDDPARPVYRRPAGPVTCPRRGP